MQPVLTGLCLAAALLAALANPYPVYADDSAPPPESQEQASPPAEESVATEESLALEAPTAAPDAGGPLEQVPAETAAAVPDQDGVEALASQAAAPDAGGLLEQVPAETAVVVLDQGSVEVLASQSAAEAIATGDPIWCPEDAVPVSGLGGCSPGFTSFSVLLSWLEANDPAAPGVIWIEKTYDSGSEGVADFVLDGRDFDDFDHQALTIQGGWNGPGTASVDHVDPSVFNGDSLYFWYWNAPITVNNVTFDGATDAGLSIHTIGDVRLSNVDAHNTLGPPGSTQGAAVWNVDGGDVEIVDSSFNGNNGEGLLVVSSGAIRMHNVAASDNASGGASLSNTSTDGPDPVTITGMNVFNDNYWSGLAVWSDGAIVLHEVDASGNYYGTADAGFGVYLENIAAATPLPVHVIGAEHTFNDNDLNGLTVNSNGDIYAENLTAIGNGRFGLTLTNSGAGGTGNIVLAGNNAFLHNRGFYGLGAFSNGTITLSQITLSGNDGDGAQIVSPVAATVTCAKVYSNGEYGIDASLASGTLTLNDVVFDLHNGLGDYAHGGPTVISEGGCHPGRRSGTDFGVLPVRIVHVFDGQLVDLACTAHAATKLILPGGEAVVIHCPALGQAVIRLISESLLPAQLPAGKSYYSALDVGLTPQTGSAAYRAGKVTVSFRVPPVPSGKELTILYWDGKSWVDLRNAHFADGRVVYGSGYESSGGTFEVAVNFTGLFVLAGQ